MRQIPDYYRILGVFSGADATAILKAFRKKAFEFHPDKNKRSDANERFIEIYEAYSVLINVQLRRKYDEKYNLQYSKPVIVDQPINFDDYDLENGVNNARKKGEYYSRIPFESFLKEIGLFGSELFFHISNAFIYFIGYGFIFFGAINLLFFAKYDGHPLSLILSPIFIISGIIILRLSTKRWDKWDKKNN